MSICNECWGKGWIKKQGVQFDCRKCKGTGVIENEPQTNEEWFCSLSTEEKAKFLFEHGVIVCCFCKRDCVEIDYKTKVCKYDVEPSYEYIGLIKWLKEIHNEM